MRNATLLAVLGAIAVACGGGGGGGSGDGSAGAALVSIALAPQSATIFEDETQAFVATGTYLDGTQAPVAVTWASSDPAVATVDANGRATGVLRGTASISAAAAADPSIGDTASLRVHKPLVYGIDGTQGLVRYAKSGGAPDVMRLAPGLPPFSELQGITYSGYSGSRLYMLHSTADAGAKLYIVDLSYYPAEVSLAGTYPVSANHFGLAADSAGRVYTVESASGPGKIWRYDPASEYDPATEAITEFAVSGADLAVDLLIDASDNIYVMKYLAFGTPLVYRVTPAGVASAVMAPPPGFLAAGGLAMTRDGTIYVGDATTGGVVYRGVDANGDGDWLDAGEVTVASGPFATLFGLRQLGSGVLANDVGTGALYLLRDLNGDGDFLDAGEQSVWSSDFVENGNGPDCMTLGEFHFIV